MVFKQNVKLANEAEHFALIGDVHAPASPFSNSSLEHEYQLRHPILSMVHPISYGGAAAGLLAAPKLGLSRAGGFAGGMATGMAIEAYHRYRHLDHARSEMAQGRSPLTPAYNVSESMHKRSSAVPFEAITVTPTVGGHFADHNLEDDYTMKHPALATMHPGIYGGAALGAAGAKLLSRKYPKADALTGALVGGVSGIFAEGAHRALYLHNARKNLEKGQPVVDPRFVAH